jgi:hypothetical protein
VKRVLKIQKVMKMMEHNFQPMVNISEISDPFCHSLKESLMTNYVGLKNPKSTQGPGHLYSDNRNPTPIDETAEFALTSSRVQSTSFNVRP